LLDERRVERPLDARDVERDRDEREDAPCREDVLVCAMLPSLGGVSVFNPLPRQDLSNPHHSGCKASITPGEGVKQASNKPPLSIDDAVDRRLPPAAAQKPRGPALVALGARNAVACGRRSLVVDGSPRGAGTGLFAR
jgi:hypothetical protein